MRASSLSMSVPRLVGTVFPYDFFGNRGHSVDSHSFSTEALFHAFGSSGRHRPEPADSVTAEERFQQKGAKVRSGSPCNCMQQVRFPLQKGSSLCTHFYAVALICTRLSMLSFACTLPSSSRW